MPLRVVEVVGMVGAGKSTLTGTVRDHLGEVGLHVYEADEAADVVVGRSWAARIVGRSGAQLLYRFVVRPLHGVAFQVENRRLAMDVRRALKASPIPRWHRRKILALFVDRGASVRFLGPRLDDDEVVVIDEGLVHRAVNVFSWQKTVDRRPLSRYLTQVPFPDLVIAVEAPAEVCLERARTRGLPKRLEGHSEADQQAFMTNAWEVVRQITDFGGDSDRRFISVDNGGDIAEAIAQLRSSLTAEVGELVGRP